MQHMKILIGLVAIVVVFFSIAAGVFLTHGYAYPLVTDQQVNPTAYHYSPECAAKQAQLQTLEAPLLAQEKPLADRLINGPFPIDNGQQLYDQYDSLRTQVDQLETKYAC